MTPSFRARTENAHKCVEKLRNIAFEIEDVQKFSMNTHVRALMGVMLAFLQEIIEHIKTEELMESG